VGNRIGREEGRGREEGWEEDRVEGGEENGK